MKKKKKKERVNGKQRELRKQNSQKLSVLKKWIMVKHLCKDDVGNDCGERQSISNNIHEAEFGANQPATRNKSIQQTQRKNVAGHGMASVVVQSIAKSIRFSAFYYYFFFSVKWIVLWLTIKHKKIKSKKGN